MTLTHLADARTAGIPDPAETITTTLNGVTFRAGRRTAAHLIATDDSLRRDGMWLRVIQPCFHSSVSASAGTHDGDGCLDVQVMHAVSWLDGQLQMRKRGWAAWYRPNTPGLWGDHIHMVSIGCPGPVGIYVPGQVEDYYAHRSGLKGHAPDTSWHPADIDSTVFDYPAFIAAQEDSMPYSDWPQKDRDALIQDISGAVVRDLLAAVVDGSKGTVKNAADRILKAFDRNGKPR